MIFKITDIETYVSPCNLNVDNILEHYLTTCEEAKDVILHNCALSTLAMQKRLDNDYYLTMTANDGIAPGLLELYSEAFGKTLFNEN